MAQEVFMQFEAPLYSKEAISKFIDECIKNESYVNNYVSMRHMMFIALDSDKIIGVISERGNGRISMLFVDHNYHRRGIATALMDKMMDYFRQLKIRWVSLESSPYAIPFYHAYGFVDTDKQQVNDGFIFTPMCFQIVEREAQ